MRRSFREEVKNKKGKRIVDSGKREYVNFAKDKIDRKLGLIPEEKVIQYDNSNDFDSFY